MNNISYNNILRYLMRGILLFLPFSIAVNFGSHQLELPTEPLLAIIGSVGLYYTYRERAWKMPFFRHPLFLVSAIYMSWTIICTLFSNHFYISAKHTTVTLAHWWVYFCLWVIVFSKSITESNLLSLSPSALVSVKERNDSGKMKFDAVPWLLYGFSFAFILFYAWWQHSQYDFRVDASVLVARPFYFDHALYSCVALLLFGCMVPFWWQRTKDSWLWLGRILSVLFLIGVYLSFSRAAWLSMFGATVLIGAIGFFRLKFKQFLIISGVLILFVVAGLAIIIPKEGSQVLSKQGDSWQHLRSTLNVSTDISNLERLNRYSCAWRMFKTKPVLGYGPGNFIIDYYPFQRPDEMTRLSVTNHGKHRAGKGGGAHSQYLQALSEMGLIGGLLWLALILMTIKTSIRILQKSTVSFNRKIVLGILFGLLTFYIHSLFNNFFHQEKVAALVWSALAVLILIDVKTDV